MLDLTFYIRDLKANNNVELSLIIISNKPILVKQDLDLFSNIVKRYMRDLVKTYFGLLKIQVKF